jgi:hypothetical protein
MCETREILLGSETFPFFANTRGVLSVDADLVRLRIYTPDGKTLLGDIGVSPQRARVIGARFIAGADKLDPKGAVKLVVEGAAL